MSYEKRYHPIDLLPDVAVGIKLPIIGVDGRLFDLSYSTEDQAISNLKNLILTRQGERLMQPLFGTKLQDSLFEQNDDILKASIKDSIERAVEFWLPYISINSLEVNPVIAVGSSREEHGVQISLQVSVNDQESNIPITFLATATTVAVI
jgi:phage baseplate assembly protein W